MADLAAADDSPPQAAAPWDREAPLVPADDLEEERSVFEAVLKDGKKKLLIQAVKDGELDFVRRAVRYGGSLQLNDGYENSLLHYACFFGREQLVHFLLTGGALLEATNNVKNTPLHLAVEGKQQHIVQLLCAKCGANTNASNMNGWTPLHTACQVGSVDMVRILLEHKALPSARSKSGSLPLDVVKDKHPLRLQEFSQLLLAPASDVAAAQSEEKVGNTEETGGAETKESANHTPTTYVISDEPPTEADVAVLATLYRQEPRVWPTKQEDAAVQRMVKACKVLLLARESGNAAVIVGFVAVTGDLLDPLLEDVLVARSQRGKGLGLQLVRAVQEHAALRAAPRIDLYCDFDLCPFYSKAGFERIRGNKGERCLMRWQRPNTK